MSNVILHNDQHRDDDYHDNNDDRYAYISNLQYSPIVIACACVPLYSNVESQSSTMSCA